LPGEAYSGHTFVPHIGYGDFRCAEYGAALRTVVHFAFLCSAANWSPVLRVTRYNKPVLFMDALHLPRSESEDEK
jgi:hypothetical protein